MVFGSSQLGLRDALGGCEWGGGGGERSSDGGSVMEELDERRGGSIRRVGGGLTGWVWGEGVEG